MDDYLCTWWTGNMAAESSYSDTNTPHPSLTRAQQESNMSSPLLLQPRLFISTIKTVWVWWLLSCFIITTWHKYATGVTGQFLTTSPEPKEPWNSSFLPDSLVLISVGMNRAICQQLSESTVFSTIAALRRHHIRRLLPLHSCLSWKFQQDIKTVLKWSCALCCCC